MFIIEETGRIDKIEYKENDTGDGYYEILVIVPFQGRAKEFRLAEDVVIRQEQDNFALPSQKSR